MVPRRDSKSRNRRSSLAGAWSTIRRSCAGTSALSRASHSSVTFQVKSTSSTSSGRHGGLAGAVPCSDERQIVPVSGGSEADIAIPGTSVPTVASNRFTGRSNVTAREPDHASQISPANRHAAPIVVVTPVRVLGRGNTSAERLRSQRRGWKGQACVRVDRFGRRGYRSQPPQTTELEGCRRQSRLRSTARTLPWISTCDAWRRTGWCMWLGLDG